MGASPTYHLYIDDTGTRYPDHVPRLNRADGMDHFAFGGYLVASEDIDQIDQAHAELISKFSLEGPLHSNTIRGKKNHFSWLRHDPDKATLFFHELNHFVLNAPIIATACVIHRPGYHSRYHAQYGEDSWKLCKSAYSILLERSAKFAAASNRKLMVYVEHTGKRENTEIKQYHREIYDNGMPFNPSTSETYAPLDAENFQELVIKTPKFPDKNLPRMQLADLVAYAIAKGQYDGNYPSYQALIKHNKLIDCTLRDAEAVKCLGVKRYCFD